MPPAQWTTARFSNGCAATGADGFEGSRQAARLFFNYSVVISAPSQGLTQTVTQTRKKTGGYRRTQWMPHRAESTQKRRKVLRSNAFRRSSYLHTQEVTGSSPAVSTTRKPWKPWYCVLFAACPYVCLSLLVPGQYAATWGEYALLRWSGGGHQAAEHGCGRLRRCPVIRPVADLRIYDLFLRYRGVGKCRDKNSKQKRRKNLPAISASYDPSCVYGSVYILYFPGR